MSSDNNPRSSLIAAEIAIVEDDLDVAEDALLETLSRVRRAKGEVPADD